jgi:uncharacterized repeat protein (TIGR01451 family)
MRHGSADHNVVRLLTSKANGSLVQTVGLVRGLIPLLLLLLFSMSAGLAFAQQNAGDWSVVGDLIAARSSHTATVLSDGRVLIAGGETSGGASNVAEIFDPANGTIRPTAGTMSVARKNHTATLLEDGRVLLAGGENSVGALASAEAYDPNSDSFTPVGSMSSARRYHTATMINAKTILIIGGEDANGSAVASMERFDVSSGEFTVATARLDVPCAQHSATLLLDGRVFIAGGRNGSTALASTSFYDPQTDSLTAGPTLDTPRYAHTATRALYGDVVLAGGTPDGTHAYDTVAVLYRDGTMGIAANKLSVARFAHVTLELANSSNLFVLGGRNDTGPVAAVDYMDPESFAFKPAPSLFTPRSEFVAFSSNGRSCVAGGNSSFGPQSSIESAQYPSLKSDRQDYSPNTQVTLTGSGWLPGETVTLNVRESDGDPDVNLAATADDQGNISNSELFTKDDAHVAFLVKAVGQSSKRTAYTRFTDLGATITLDPDRVSANNNPFTLRILGAGFSLGQNTVYVQGTNLGPGTTVWDNEIDVTVPAGVVSTEGSYSVYVSQLYTYTTQCCSQQCYQCNGHCCTMWCTSTCWNTCCETVCNACQQQATYNTDPSLLTVTSPAVPPVLNEEFGAGSIPLNQSTSLHFIIQNTNTTALNGIGFTDTLPSGLVISTPNGLTGSCYGGTIAATRGTNSISLTGLSLPAGVTCTFAVNVTGTAPGVVNNVTTPINSTEGGTGAPASASVTVVAPISVAQSFSPTTVSRNAPSVLTFSLTNGNVVPIDASFTDTLPANLVMAIPAGVVNNCGGTVINSLPLPATSLSFSNPALPVGTCTITVNVQSAVDNIYNNSVTINSTAAGTDSTSTSSTSLTVINPPAITTAFGAATIPLNGTSSLTFTVTSTNTNLTLNGVAFTDTLPPGMVVATPNGFAGSCFGGTITPVAGSNTVSLSGANVSPGYCSFVVNVTGTTVGAKNNSVQVTSTNGGTGNTSNASVTVVGPPTISKNFGAGSIPLNGSTSLSFTIQNNNTTTTLTGIAFSDPLPAGLVVSTPNGIAGSCGGGTITATAGAGVVSLSGATLSQSTSCTFSVNVIGTTAGQKNNSTGAVTSTEGGTGGSASTTVIVVAPPSIAKSFSPTTTALNGTTTLTFTITNPAANTVAETGVAFIDTLPAGLVVSTPNGLSNTCNGTATAVAGSTGISLTGGSIAVNTSCTVVVNVTGTASGQYASTSSAVTSTNGGTGNTASANLTVASPPTITKLFGVSQIPLNGTTSLTFTIQNPNTSVTLTGIAFTDNLPAGMVVASTPNLSSTCGGTATAVGGSGSISLSGGTLAASASCTVSVSVQGTTAGVKNNSVQVTSTEGGTGNTSNASIGVVGPPAIIKSFGAASIPLNGSTSLTFTINNPNATYALNGLGFSDTLPAGLIISTPNGLSGNCGAGTITAAAGTNVITLSGGATNPAGSCIFSVNVTGTSAGQQNNTTGNVTSTEGGTGGTASASVNIVAPPSITKVFNPAAITLNAATSLTFTITNPAANAVALTGVAFTDALPSGITVANASATVCGGTLTTTAPSGIALSAATITVNSQCQFIVTVTGVASGQYTNTTGAVTSTNGGTGNTATADLTVASPPTVTKAFGAPSISLNGTTSLTFTIQNPNAGVALTGLLFSDTMPAGLVIASTPNLSNTCGGTAAAVGGSTSASLSGGTLAASASCTVSVNVIATAIGTKNNSVQVTSTEGGIGNNSIASITIAPLTPTVTIIPSPASPAAVNTYVTFTASLTGVTLTPVQPSGTFTFAANGTAIPGCTTGVDPVGTATCSVSSLTAGVNTITATYSADANYVAAAPGSASYTITPLAPTVTLAAVPASPSQLNTAVTFTATLTGVTLTPVQPSGTFSFAVNGTAISGCAAMPVTPEGVGSCATSSLPAGSNTITATYSADPNYVAAVPGNTNYTVNALQPTVTITAVPASPSVVNSGVSFTASLSGVSLTPVTPSGNFSFAANGATISGCAAMPVSTAGLATCATSSLPAGPNAITATYSADPNYVASAPGGTSYTMNPLAPTVMVTTSPANSSPVNGSVTFTASLTGVPLTPTTPLGSFNFAANGTTINGCAASAVTTAGVATCSTATLPAGSNTIIATYSADPNFIASDPGSAGYTIVAPPSIAEVFSPTHIPRNGTTSLTFTITNPAANTAALTGVGFSNTLPGGLTVTDSSAGVCGGTLTTTAPTAIAFSGATISTNSQCQFSVTVAGAVSGSYVNTTGYVTSTNGGTGNSASANLGVAMPPTITKAFGATHIPLNGVTSLTFTIANPNSSIALTGTMFTDDLPAGLTVAPTPNLSNTCGGTASAVAGSESVGISGATLAASATCTVSVDVQGATAGVKNNTTGAISTTESGSGSASNTASLTVVAPPEIGASFGAPSIPLGGATSLSFSISNPNTGNALTGVAFTNMLPAGLLTSTPNGLTGTCGAGTITAAAGANSLSLTGATLVAGGSCTISVNVTGIHAGTQVDTSGSVTSVDGGTGATASANLTVDQTSTTTTIVSAGSKHFGEAATFTATVSSTVGTPAGTVNFLEGTTPLGSAALDAGVATFSDSALVLGTHAITAEYQGNSDYVGSVSPAVSQEVTVPLVTITGNSSLTVSVGKPGVLPLTIGSAGTLSAAVVSTCSGLPVGAQCIFSPMSVGPGSLPASLELTVTTARLKIVGQNKSPGSLWAFAMLLPAICVLPFTGKGGKRRWLRLAFGLALLSLLTFAVGCGGSPNSAITNVQQSTTPGTYTVTVTGTSAGATQGSMTFNLTVTP